MYELRDENMGSLDKKASKLSDTLRIVATYAVLLFHYFCQKNNLVQWMRLLKRRQELCITLL